MDIAGFVRRIERDRLQCEGVVVLRGGEQIARHRWIPEAPRNSFSVSKSFTAIAIGMAIERGKLALSSRVLDAFPDLVREPDQRLSALTLEHLLTMTRGHAVFSRPLTAAAALEQELSFEPGSRFVYDNGSTLLASAMFTRAMGQRVRDFLVTALFEPLGIPGPEWTESADGHSLGATGLFLDTASLARFGQLLLQRGRWGNEQLVPARWIDRAGRAQVSTGENQRPDWDLGYGYGFWPSRHGAYRADGKDGQFLVVLPGQDAVVAVNSDEERHYPVLYAIWDEILPLL
jgi:CubicO group peptidase (beta-lactamase class C family)